jgi:4,5-DOPA dioxygenase extradiol
MLLDDGEWVAELAAWGKALGKPRAILIVSGHWEHAPLAIGATRVLPPIYDFSGFPQRFYQLQYPAPGAPELAARVRALLDGAGIAHTDEPARGHDHGVYVPLLCMYPQADVPVLQLSLPTNEPEPLFEVGRALAPLAQEGCLIAGSGFLVHNLRVLRSNTPPTWAVEFDSWCADVLARGDFDALIDYRTRAPGVRESLPTHEHFTPLLVAAGAAAEAKASQVSFPITGFWMNGAMTRRSVQFVTP